jgi:hypothetical protein
VELLAPLCIPWSSPPIPLFTLYSSYSPSIALVTLFLYPPLYSSIPPSIPLCTLYSSVHPIPLPPSIPRFTLYSSLELSLTGLGQFDKEDVRSNQQRGMSRGSQDAKRREREEEEGTKRGGREE